MKQHQTFFATPGPHAQDEQYDMWNTDDPHVPIVNPKTTLEWGFQIQTLSHVYIYNHTYGYLVHLSGYTTYNLYILSRYTLAWAAWVCLNMGTPQIHV
jgi:hypothetical protein